MTCRVYVPEPVRLTSGRIVRRGRYHAEINDGAATIHVTTFGLGDTLEVYNDELKARWKKPPGGARIYLLPSQFEMHGEPIESPIDAVVL